MNTKQLIIQTSVIFSGLTTAGIIIAINAQVVPDAFAQTIMISFGSAIFGAGLTFFLIRIVTHFEK
jgi:hypothetical protein